MRRNDNLRLIFYVVSFILVSFILLALFQLQGSAREETTPTINQAVVYQRNTIPEPRLWRIIECESGGNSKAQNPHSTAYGLCQFLDGTWQYVENKWEIDLDRDDPFDQLYACKRLLKEEGAVHWRASAHCHGYY